MSILLSTSGVVAIVTCLILLSYDVLSFRKSTVSRLVTVGELIATNSTAALAFADHAAAAEILRALRAEPEVAQAALYDRSGRLFASYPSTRPRNVFPPEARPDAVTLTGSTLEIFQPVMQEDRRLGTIYLRSELASAHQRFALYGLVALVVTGAALGVSYMLSRVLQRQISEPILALAETARAVSERRDYSVRAPTVSGEELSRLTEAFNHMLTQIQVRDVALQEGAERMRAVLDSALSAVVIADSDGCVIDWTARAEAVFGWPRAEAIGREVADLLVPPSQRDEYRRIFGRRIVAGDPAYFGRTFETTAMRRDGTELTVEVAVSALRTGSELTFCGFATDVTARKQAEQQLHALNLELERRVAERTAQFETAHRELEAFTYSVSHDLRAPLRHVDGFAGMLQRHAGATLDAAGQRYLNTISEAARNMGRLIDDLLAFSRTGRAALHVVPVDLDAMVADVITQGSFSAGERPVRWQVHPLPQVLADPALLRLVWINLIGNAAKYSSRSEAPHIEVGTRPAGTNGEQVFYVRDNGVGFDMKYASKLFGVFQRLHSSLEFEGTGIGLAHVKRIISRHGGRVWAEGHPGVGATFYFSLPASPPVSNTAAPFG